ncbi:MAG: hypothetical protein E7432_04685 [Ruminococcaceae bacterium]|nr:hypothetical protein [Oscillospiraceae bacterium]
MISDFLSLIKTIFFDWLRLDWVIDIIDGLLSDDEFRADRTKAFVRGFIWLALIVIPLLTAIFALFMKAAVIWEILLFIPSLVLFIFFISLWWKRLNGE